MTTNRPEDLYFPQGAPASRSAVLLRFLSVPVLLAALPLFLVAGWGLQSWLLAAGLWLVNLGISWSTGRFILGLPQTIAVAVAGFGLLFRAWGTMAALLVAAHFAGADVALPAAILFALVFTVDLIVRGMLYANSRRMPAERLA